MPTNYKNSHSQEDNLVNKVVKISLPSLGLHNNTILLLIIIKIVFCINIVVPLDKKRITKDRGKSPEAGFICMMLESFVIKGRLNCSKGIIVLKRICGVGLSGKDGGGWDQRLG